MVSLRIIGTHRVTVIKRERVEGDRGRSQFREIGRTEIQGSLRQLSTGDVQAVGVDEISHLRSLMCVNFPGDDVSLVEDQGGGIYEVIGEPRRFQGSRNTRHDVVILRRIGANRGESF